MTADIAHINLLQSQIYIGADITAHLADYVPGGVAGRVAFIISDENTGALYAENIRTILQAGGARAVHVKILPPGEGTKSFANLQMLTEWMLACEIDRDAVIISVGGGVIGDLSGLCASVILRGVLLIHIPTTLLAQVDSAVGGKNAINSPHGKNMIGTFYQPGAVICDTSLLASLPAREMRAGYAEIVKYGLLGDADFFAWLEENGRAILSHDPDTLRYAIEKSCRMKAEIVAEDEREQGRRALLNLGHTFAHALERIGGYDGRILHGEAVAVGMALAFALSARLGLCTREDLLRVTIHMRRVGLPNSLRDLSRLHFTADDILAAMRHDKKNRDGRIVLVLARGIGDAILYYNAQDEDILAVIHESMG